MGKLGLVSIIALIMTVAIVIIVAAVLFKPKEGEAVIQETSVEVVESSTVYTEQKEKPKSLADNIEDDVNSLKAGDKEVIARYFGESVGLNSSLFKELSLKIIEESPEEVNVEITNLDFNRIYNLRSEYSEQIKKQNVGISDSDLKSYVDSSLAEQVQKDDYTSKWCITIRGKGNTVTVTEDLKKALSGGWYNSLGCSILPIKQ